MIHLCRVVSFDFVILSPSKYLVLLNETTGGRQEYFIAAKGILARKAQKEVLKTAKVGKLISPMNYATQIHNRLQ